MPWIDTLKPATPQVKQQGDNGWLIKSNATVRYFILYNAAAATASGGHAPASILQILGANNGQAVYYQPMHAGDGPSRIAVTAVSKGNIESDAVNLIE